MSTKPDPKLISAMAELHAVHEHSGEALVAALAAVANLTGARHTRAEELADKIADVMAFAEGLGLAIVAELEPVECQWFAGCRNDATTTRAHPILGDLPICQRCNDKTERMH